MAADETGSGLNIFFDQTADTGFRQARLGGYDRRDVDAYVKEVEQRLRSQQQRVERLEHQLAEAQQSEPTAVIPTGPESEADVGARTSAILQMAQQQARQVVETAEQEAARRVGAARRQGEEITQSAQRDAEDVRLTTQAHADAQRARLERETGGQVERARAEAEILLDRARQQAAVIEHEAVTMAEQTRESGRRDADVLRQQASTQAAQWRLEAETTRSEVLSTLQAEHDGARTALAASLAEHTEHRQRADQELAEVVAESARIRSAAVVEADEARTRVLRETENQVAVTQQQAKISLERATERHSARLDNLKREIASLQERRQGIVSQLSHLSAMVNDTAGQFSLDPGADDEEGEQTPSPGPTGTGSDHDEPSAEDLSEGPATEQATGPVGGEQAVEEQPVQGSVQEHQLQEQAVGEEPSGPVAEGGAEATRVIRRTTR